MITITKIDPFTGKENTMKLDITEEQLAEYESPGSRMIQQIFPNLAAYQREFMMTGIMPDSWNELFSGSEQARNGEDHEDSDETTL